MRRIRAAVRRRTPQDQHVDIVIRGAPDAERIGPALLTPDGPGIVEMLGMMFESAGLQVPPDISERLARLGFRSLDAARSRRKGARIANRKRSAARDPRAARLKLEFRRRFRRYQELRLDDVEASRRAIAELAAEENITPERMRRVVEPRKERRNLTSR